MSQSGTTRSLPCREGTELLCSENLAGGDPAEVWPPHANHRVEISMQGTRVRDEPPIRRRLFADALSLG